MTETSSTFSRRDPETPPYRFCFDELEDVRCHVVLVTTSTPETVDPSDIVSMMQLSYPKALRQIIEGEGNGLRPKPEKDSLDKNRQGNLGVSIKSSIPAVGLRRRDDSLSSLVSSIVSSTNGSHIIFERSVVSRARWETANAATVLPPYGTGSQQSGNPSSATFSSNVFPGSRSKASKLNTSGTVPSLSVTGGAAISSLLDAFPHCTTDSIYESLNTGSFWAVSPLQHAFALQVMLRLIVERQRRYCHALYDQYTNRSQVRIGKDDYEGSLHSSVHPVPPSNTGSTPPLPINSSRGLKGNPHLRVASIPSSRSVPLSYNTNGSESSSSARDGGNGITLDMVYASHDIIIVVPCRSSLDARMMLMEPGETLDESVLHKVDSNEPYHEIFSTNIDALANPISPSLTPHQTPRGAKRAEQLHSRHHTSASGMGLLSDVEMIHADSVQRRYYLRMIVEVNSSEPVNQPTLPSMHSRHTTQHSGGGDYSHGVLNKRGGGSSSTTMAHGGKVLRNNSFPIPLASLENLADKSQISDGPQSRFFRSLLWRKEVNRFGHWLPPRLTEYTKYVTIQIPSSDMIKDQVDAKLTSSTPSILPAMTPTVARNLFRPLSTGAGRGNNLLGTTAGGGGNNLLNPISERDPMGSMANAGKVISIQLIIDACLAKHILNALWEVKENLLTLRHCIRNYASFIIPLEHPPVNKPASLRSLPRLFASLLTDSSRPFSPNYCSNQITESPQIHTVMTALVKELVQSTYKRVLTRRKMARFTSTLLYTEDDKGDNKMASGLLHLSKISRLIMTTGNSEANLEKSRKSLRSQRGSNSRSSSSLRQLKRSFEKTLHTIKFSSRLVQPIDKKNLAYQKALQLVEADFQLKQIEEERRKKMVKNWLPEDSHGFVLPLSKKIDESSIEAEKLFPVPQQESRASKPVTQRSKSLSYGAQSSLGFPSLSQEKGSDISTMTPSLKKYSFSFQKYTQSGGTKTMSPSRGDNDSGLVKDSLSDEFALMLGPPFLLMDNDLPKKSIDCSRIQMLVRATMDFSSSIGSLMHEKDSSQVVCQVKPFEGSKPSNATNEKDTFLYWILTSIFSHIKSLGASQQFLKNVHPPCSLQPMLILETFPDINRNTERIVSDIVPNGSSPLCSAEENIRIYKQWKTFLSEARDILKCVIPEINTNDSSVRARQDVINLGIKDGGNPLTSLNIFSLIQWVLAELVQEKLFDGQLLIPVDSLDVTLEGIFPHVHPGNSKYDWFCNLPEIRFRYHDLPLRTGHANIASRYLTKERLNSCYVDARKFWMRITYGNQNCHAISRVFPIQDFLHSMNHSNLKDAPIPIIPGLNEVTEVVVMGISIPKGRQQEQYGVCYLYGIPSLFQLYNWMIDDPHSSTKQEIPNETLDHSILSAVLEGAKTSMSVRESSKGWAGESDWSIENRRNWSPLSFETNSFHSSNDNLSSEFHSHSSLGQVPRGISSALSNSSSRSSLKNTNSGTGGHSHLNHTSSTSQETGILPPSTFSHIVTASTNHFNSSGPNMQEEDMESEDNKVNIYESTFVNDPRLKFEVLERLLGKKIIGKLSQSLNELFTGNITDNFQSKAVFSHWWQRTLFPHMDAVLDVSLTNTSRVLRCGSSEVVWTLKQLISPLAQGPLLSKQSKMKLSQDSVTPQYFTASFNDDTIVSCLIQRKKLLLESSSARSISDLQKSEGNKLSMNADNSKQLVYYDMNITKGNLTTQMIDPRLGSWDVTFTRHLETIDASNHTSLNLCDQMPVANSTSNHHMPLASKKDLPEVITGVRWCPQERHEISKSPYDENKDNDTGLPHGYVWSSDELLSKWSIVESLEWEVSRRIDPCRGIITRYFASGGWQKLYPDGSVMTTLSVLSGYPCSTESLPSWMSLWPLFTLITLPYGERWVVSHANKMVTKELEKQFNLLPQKRWKAPSLKVVTHWDPKERVYSYSRKDGVLILNYHIREMDKANIETAEECDNSEIYLKQCIHADSTLIISFIPRSTTWWAPVIESLQDEYMSLRAFGFPYLLIKHRHCPRTWILRKENPIDQSKDIPYTSPSPPFLLTTVIDFADGSRIVRCLKDIEGIDEKSCLFKSSLDNLVESYDNKFRYQFYFQRPTGMRIHLDSELSLIFVQPSGVSSLFNLKAKSRVEAVHAAMWAGIPIIDLISGSVRLVDYRSCVFEISEILSVDNKLPVISVTQRTPLGLLLELTSHSYFPLTLSKKRKESLEAFRRSLRPQTENRLGIPPIILRLQKITEPFIVSRGLISVDLMLCFHPVFPWITHKHALLEKQSHEPEGDKYLQALSEVNSQEDPFSQAQHSDAQVQSHWNLHRIFSSFSKTTRRYEGKSSVYAKDLVTEIEAFQWGTDSCVEPLLFYRNATGTFTEILRFEEVKQSLYHLQHLESQGKVYWTHFSDDYNGKNQVCCFSVDSRQDKYRNNHFICSCREKGREYLTLCKGLSKNDGGDATITLTSMTDGMFSQWIPQMLCMPKSIQYAFNSRNHGILPSLLNQCNYMTESPGIELKNINNNHHNNASNMTPSVTDEIGHVCQLPSYHLLTWWRHIPSSISSQYVMLYQTLQRILTIYEIQGRSIDTLESPSVISSSFPSENVH